MTTAIRQRKLFVAEDWKVIYRAFTEINFAAYDFDTIRDAMLDHIRFNFPEDFNDWIESSEFVALIELLAYLGQSLAFRMDLNTRENFLDTAERRESILKLARMLSYIPSRNFPATGLLKLSQVSTNEPIIDSSGTNLSNLSITWNDPNNPDWFEQFILVLNSIFSSTTPFGKPIKDGTVGGIKTQLYEFNNEASSNRVFPFSSVINGDNINFEIVNSDFTDGEIFFERDPDPEDPLHLIFRTDGNGNDSPNTGFFMLFKQGSLLKEDFRIDVPIENRVLDIEGININNIDVFVQEIDEEGFIVEKWESVPAIVGNNIIFNSVQKDIRNIYNVITRTNDQITIRFADGRFGNVPTGLFRIWFRESLGERFQISPEDMRNIRLDIPYLDKVNNSVFFSSFTLDLQESVITSTPTETSTSIKERAPQIFYTQDRMVNGEDYNILPLRNPEAAKLKATNRIHSGFSRHIDINDPTGFSQDVNLFAEDGLVYFEENNRLQELALPTNLTDRDIVNQIILPLVQELERRHFFYFHYPRFEPTVPSFTQQGQPLKSGTTGSLFTIGETVYTAGASQVFKISDGITDTGIFSLTTAPGTVDNAIIDILAALTTAGMVDPNGVTVANIGASDQLQIFVQTDGKELTITQESSGTALQLLGIQLGTLPARDYGTFWRSATNAVNSSTGNFFTDPDTIGPIPESAIIIGANVSGTPEFFLQEGALVKFKDAGFVSIINVFGDGNVILSNGDGAVRLAEDVDDEDIVEEIFLPFRTLFSEIETIQIVNQLDQKNTFGLRYDPTVLGWFIISGDNLAPENKSFSLDPLDGAGSTSGLNKDSSWLIRIEFGTTNWRFISRGLDYIIESKNEIRFFHSDDEKIVDSQTGRTVIDFIKFLKINTAFEVSEIGSPILTKADFFEINPVESINKDIIFNVEGVFTETDSFVDPKKLKVTFTDLDEDGVPDDPTIFETITKITGLNVDLELPDEEVDETELFWRAFTNTDGFKEFSPTEDVKAAFNAAISLPPDSNDAVSSFGLADGDVIFDRENQRFFVVDEANGVDPLPEVTEQYFARRGRDALFFQWKHFASANNRIDPAITNIIDMYVLTTSYDISIRQWIDDGGDAIEFPEPPTTEQLRILFAEEVENKMLSDEIIFHPVRYKLLFGEQAPEQVQARFKVTKVEGTEVSDGEIKARVISAINEFFAINNWDFGEIFYYTELAAFVHQQLAAVIGSIVLVPLDDEQKFGDLFQVRSEPDEVFISTAKVSDVQIVTAFTDDNLRIGN